MNTHEINQLIERFGDIKLSEWAEIQKQDRKFPCPKCKTTGLMIINVPYPSGFPDSGWVPDSQEQRRCNLCDGIGFTKQEMQAVSAVVSYEPKESEQ